MPGIAEVKAVKAALVGLDHPPDPTDGDCLTWSDLVTEELLAQGHDDARTVRVWGWLSERDKLVGFVHAVTLVDGVIVVDFTARQCDLDLPARWIAPVADYCRQLAQATGVVAVTVEGLMAGVDTEVDPETVID